MSDLMPWMAPWSGRLLAIALFMAGMWLIRRSVRRRRFTDHPICPKCRYNLTGLIADGPVTCPECGFTTGNAIERQAISTRRWGFAAAGLILAFALPAFVVSQRVHQFGWEYYLRYGPGYWISPTYVADRLDINGYSVVIRKNRRWLQRESSCTIVRAGKVEMQFSDADCEIMLFSESEWGQPGADLNGNGIPDVVISQTDLGNHGLSTTHVLELAPAGLKELARIQRPLFLLGLNPVDPGGPTEIIVCDVSTFMFWNGASHAGSPAPRAVMVAGPDGRYRISAARMRRPAISDNELATRAAEVTRTLVQSQNLGDVSEDLWGTMIELICTGHAARAYEFFDEAWPGGILEGREQFLRDFRQQLSKSPLAAAMEELTHPASNMQLGGIAHE